MKIYVCHSSAFDYKEELYKPIRNSKLNNEHEFILPHEVSEQTFNSKEIIPHCDLIISEVSYPSTGLGIELGWANKEDKKILFISKTGTPVARSLKILSSDFIEYTDYNDLIEKLTLFINNLNTLYFENEKAELIS
ncbi:hypothetical protein HY214_00190 [Candidatus Roizmanbacteria bacterium]|nr:hypothetical protein [Candidatus Roizmanbacteria bacterium]